MNWGMALGSINMEWNERKDWTEEKINCRAIFMENSASPTGRFQSEITIQNC